MNKLEKEIALLLSMKSEVQIVVNNAPYNLTNEELLFMKEYRDSELFGHDLKIQLYTN